MTDNATSKAVATPLGEPTDHVDIDGTTEADEIEAYWESNTPTLSELKTHHKRAIKRQARAVLSETDWYVIRNQEQAIRGPTQDSIPTTVTDHRDQVRSLESQAMSDIDAADTKDAVRAVTVDWPDPPDPPL